MSFFTANKKYFQVQYMIIGVDLVIRHSEMGGVRQRNVVFFNFFHSYRFFQGSGDAGDS